MYKILYNLPERDLPTLHGFQVLNSSDNIRMWDSPSCKTEPGEMPAMNVFSCSQHSDCICVLGDCKLDYLSIQRRFL
jgi:hypothetical protein